MTGRRRRGTRAARTAQTTGRGWQKREAAEWALLHLQLVAATEYMNRVAAVLPEVFEAIGKLCDWVIVTAAASRDDFALADTAASFGGPQIHGGIVDEVSDPRSSAALDKVIV